MTVSVVQIGNSRGIRLPKNILRELNIKDEMEMSTRNDELILKRVDKKPRLGWDDAFAKMPKAKEDALLLPEHIDSESFEWVW